MSAPRPRGTAAPGRADHVVIAPDGGVQCMRCDLRHNPHGPTGRPVELWEIVALMKGFAKKHARCLASASLRCYACLEIGHELEQHVALKVHTPSAWPGCGDTGSSSTALWQHMARGAGGRDEPHPLDPDDFGRCYRLLSAPWAKSWRARIGEMAKHGPVWAALAGAWDELEALYLEERQAAAGPKLWKRMRECAES